jgi:hypothetical protein
MNFGSKPKGLAFGFTKKHLITMRTDQKSIFHPCEILILARLDITVLYTIFLWFWKFLSFAWELKGFRLRFYLQTSVHSENRSKICISSPWDTYSFLVRHYGGVYIFFRFWKISSFDLKSKDVRLWFYQKHLFVMKTGQKSVFHPSEFHILTRLDITVLYTFFRFWKISSFASKPKGVTEKRLFVAKINQKIRILSSWDPYSFSIRHFDDIHKFLSILKNNEFRLKTQRVSLRFY